MRPMVLATILTVATPAFAQAETAWSAFLSYCLTPMSYVQPVVLDGVGTLEDGVHRLDGDILISQPEPYLCQVQGPDLNQPALAWLSKKLAEDQYSIEERDGNGFTVRSTFWREPVLRVVYDPESNLIVVEETVEEA